MQKNIVKMSIAAIACMTLATSAQATLKSDKVTLKGNMVVKFNKLPKPVNTIKEAFSEGIFYGRLRANAFYWDWDDQTSKNKSNRNLGVGASLIYKSAPLNGISGTIGLYTTQSPFFRMDKDMVGFSKAGKDTFSRDKIKNGGDFDGTYGLTVIGQAYLQYDLPNTKTTFKLGRQMIETVFTKSNDTKMIPNTFDALTATIKDIPNTTIKLAYIGAQKLRDHESSHDVIAFNAGKDADGNSLSWSENDDSAVNKSLTINGEGGSTAVGNKNELIVASVTTKAIKNLKANVSYAMVPDVVSNLTLEAHYTIPVGDWKIVPGIRYMEQMDDLDATGNVAALKGPKASNVVGYTDATSLDSNLLAMRMDFKKGAFLGRIGYSKIADEADIVAPWRGFPTGGFTRAMAQYNWVADTETLMFRAGYDFGKAGIIPGFSAMVRYAIQDFDEAKTGNAADSNVIHMDLRQNIGKDLELKFRLGMVDADEKGGKDDSYNEYRLELNYFF